MTALSLLANELGPSTIDGTGDDVFIVQGTLSTAHILGNKDSRYFSVKAYSDTVTLLVSTTDPYDARVIVPSDAVIIEVKASGGWTITFE